MRIALAALVALGLACSRKAPADAYLSFAAAAQEHDLDRVWSMLSTETQERFETLADAARKALPGGLPEQARSLLIGSALEGSSSIAPGGVLVLRESPDRAELRITDGSGRSRKVTMVREEGWRLDLTADLPGPGGAPR